MPCRDQSYADVEDILADGSVTSVLNSVGLDAGKQFYVELLGTLEDGTLKASAFNMARVEGRCQLPGGKEESWRPAGNDPAWALVAGGEHIHLRLNGKPQVVLPYAEFSNDGTVSSYQGAQEGNKLAVRFEHTLCRDAEANGELFKGCAWQR